MSKEEGTSDIVIEDKDIIDALNRKAAYFGASFQQSAINTLLIGMADQAIAEAGGAIYNAETGELILDKNQAKYLEDEALQNLYKK